MRRCSTEPTLSPEPSRKRSSGPGCRTKWRWRAVYERREVRDAIAYLRAIANRADDVSLRRILNVPCGVSVTGRKPPADLANREGLSFGDALRRVDEIPGLASRSLNQLTASPSSLTTTKHWWQRAFRQTPS